MGKQEDQARGTARKDQRQITGRQGEDIAASYLTQHNYTIVERNWRCRSGELDIIARDNDLLVIIEVRSRKSVLQFGHPVESVEQRKQVKVRRTAEVYLTMTRQTCSQVRFDVITVMLAKDGTLQEINHYPNAF